MQYEEKQPWEMTEEEQKKYYDKKTDEIIDTTLGHLFRFKIFSNKTLREKIKNFITKELEENIKKYLKGE